MSETPEEIEAPHLGESQGLKEAALLEAERELAEVERALEEPNLLLFRRVALIQERRDCKERVFGLRIAVGRAP
jgi:hypothetical protein